MQLCYISPTVCYADWSVFTTGPILTVQTLLTELADIPDWFMLGIYIGVEASQLHKIQANFPNVSCDRYKAELFHMWLRDGRNCSWATVIKALKDMGENKLADKLRKKFHSECMSSDYL